MRPLRKRAQFLDSRARGFDGVANRVIGGIEDSQVAAEVMGMRDVSNAMNFEYELSRYQSFTILPTGKEKNIPFSQTPIHDQIFNLEPMVAKLISSILTAVSSSNCEIQSTDSTSGPRRKGRYLDLISGSSSFSEMASREHYASVRNRA